MWTILLSKAIHIFVVSFNSSPQQNTNKVIYLNTLLMNFSESEQVECHTLKEQLVPHFHLLDHNVQKDIVYVLELLVSQHDKRELQEFSRLGHLEEAPLLRAHIWKLLLETLPPDPQRWNETKQTNCTQYWQLVDKLIGRYVDEEDLLGLKEDFDWQLWGEIELDTRRTHSALNFFQKTIDHTQIYQHKATRNSDVLSRILYIWGRTNATVRYVQGMNEILAPLYYLQFQKFTPFAESEVFFMFSSLMNFSIDLHIKEMDQSEQGIMGRMRLLNRYLKVVDLQVWRRLEEEKIEPQYYSFRWLSLLLAQEFGLYETMKLWDVLLAYDDQRRHFFLNCCCIAILKFRRNVIQENDFINILPAIQKLRDVNVNFIIETAQRLYDKYSRLNVEKLYLQLNQQLQRKNSNEKVEEEEVDRSEEGKWNYSSIVEKTGSFLAKMVGRK